MLNASFLASALLTGTLGVPGAAPVIRGEMLPIPAELSVRATDVTQFGVVAGNVQTTSTGPDGSISTVDLPQRWIPVPRAGWVRQPLTLPAGATSGTVDELTDAGEAAGSLTLGTARAARWSITGRSVTVLDDRPSSTTAAGRNGPWGVSTFDGVTPVTGEAGLVTRAGVHTPLRGTPELDAGNRRIVDSIGGPGTALIRVNSGFGRGLRVQPVLWRSGATLRLPVVGTYDLGPVCLSRVRADGSVVYGGFRYDNGVYASVLIRHVGGVPGTDVTLVRATAADQPRGGIDCTYGGPNNMLASDGGLAGYLLDSNGQRAAYWDPDNRLTVVPHEAGHVFALGVAAAGGGRMAILARHEDGTDRLSLWDDGVRTPLAAPPGWIVTSVVELTDAGLLVANVRNAAGQVRPAVWRIQQRR